MNAIINGKGALLPPSAAGDRFISSEKCFRVKGEATLMVRRMLS
jgi:hypothetical protein